MLLRNDSFVRLCQAREALTEVREHPMSIQEVAREARLSPFHFIRQFEAVFGITPHQFRIQARLDQAKILLAKGELSVTEVCMEVGMSSLGSFSDLFARHVGEAPSNYRRRARVMMRAPGVLPHALFPGCFSMMGYLPMSAFRNFEEAMPNVLPVELAHANQAHQPDGR